jgi:hypothetical protein
MARFDDRRQAGSPAQLAMLPCRGSRVTCDDQCPGHQMAVIRSRRGRMDNPQMTRRLIGLFAGPEPEQPPQPPGSADAGRPTTFPFHYRPSPASAMRPAGHSEPRVRGRESRRPGLGRTDGSYGGRRVRGEHGPPRSKLRLFGQCPATPLGVVRRDGRDDLPPRRHAPGVDRRARRPG